MKRIIALLIVTVLCFGMLTGCDVINGILGNNQTQEPSVTVAEAIGFLDDIMTSKNPVTMADYDVVGMVKISGVTFPITWTVDNDKIVVRESTKAGYYTVDLPDQNTEEFSYTLTATISANGESDSKSYTFTMPVVNNSGITSTPVEGVAYKLFLLQGKLGQRFYALATTQDNGNKFINTTLDPKEAVDYYVEVVDGGYKVYTTVDGVKNYISVRVEKTVNDAGATKYSKFIGFSTEDGTVLKYNENIGGVWTANVEGIDWGIGTYNAFTTISVSESTYFSADNNGVTQFVMQFVTSDYAETLEPDGGAENNDDAAAILDQLYGLASNESVTGSFTVTGVITELDSYGNPTIVVNGDTARPIYCYKLTNSGFVVGATIKVTALTMKNYNGTYEFMDCTLDELTAPENGDDNTDPAPTVDIITNPEVGVAYKFGLFHGNENATVFFNGQNYNNYAWYFAYDATGIDVYLEAVEGVDGGYRLFFYNGDAKTYVVAFPRDGDTTKGTLKFDTVVPDTYFTFNTEYNTLIYTSVTGEQFYLGSSGTYKSISCSAISYITNADSYVSHLYAADVTGGDNSGDNGGNEGSDPVLPPVVDGNEIVFDFGANGTAGTHADGNDIGTTKSYTVGGYTLTLTDALKAFDGGFDKAGNSILKFGTSSVAGTITFVVPENVTSVVIYAARYKNYADNNIIVVNGVEYSLNTNSDDGQYEAITVDTTTNKTVTVASSTSAAKPRCVVNSIVWVIGEGGSDAPVDPQPPVHEHNFVEGKCECGEEDPNYVAPEAPAFGVVDPVVGTAYKFGMVQSKAGKTVYLVGGMSGYYMATTEDVNAAIDVYLEETDGGYYLYTLNADGSKLYINMVVSGTHVNGAYEATASTVYTYDADRKSIVATVNDALYHFGTRNDNTYLTVGPCKVSYAGFDCQFYGATATDTPVDPQPPVHEHNFVEGKCECGEEDPNYVPPVEEKVFLTIPEAIAMATAQGDAYTSDKYYITGIVTKISNTFYGNFYLVDAEGNELYVYGLKDATGAGNFSGLDPQPAVGDTLTIYTVLGCYQGAPQAKDAWFYELVKHTEHTWTDATCKVAKTCTICGAVDGEPLDHTYVDGACTGCGKAEPAQGTIITSTENFDGLTKGSSYTTQTTTSGWSATNAAVLVGGTSDANPVFTFIGSSDAVKAITLNGKVGASGVLTSATIKNGISKLSFNYGHAFSDKNGVDLTINILKNGEVVATTRLDNDAVTQKTAYEFTWELDVAVEGDIVIEIVNNSPTNKSSGNADRVSIFNISWDSAPIVEG